jgi:putative ABC transport system substrate-binding protein
LADLAFWSTDTLGHRPMTSCFLYRRRNFITLLGGAAAWPLGARAQQAAKVARIGFLGLAPASIFATRVDALRIGLRDLGYIENKNINYRIQMGSNCR